MWVMSVSVPSEHMEYLKLLFKPHYVAKIGAWRTLKP